MADNGSSGSGHDHYYFATHQQSNERKTWAVIVLTLVTMVLEIFSGVLFGSMALLADGWHMASHASALGITALAYYLAGKHKDNPKFTFGTGKIGDLAGYSSALLLLFIAIFMAYESIMRLINPVSIRFHEAILVAAVGLVVNLISAFILREHPHDDETEHHHRDHNLRSAYLHVLADALTSILAIVALGLGLLFDWFFLDPVMGIVGAVLITRWSYGLMREAGSVLLDRTSNEWLVEKITEVIKKIEGVRILDLHVWRLGPGHYSAIVSLGETGKEPPEFFKQRLRHIKGLSHLTIEVNS
jgi:cation diffusion facilitator family transporter